MSDLTITEGVHLLATHRSKDWGDAEICHRDWRKGSGTGVAQAFHRDRANKSPAIAEGSAERATRRSDAAVYKARIHVKLGSIPRLAADQEKLARSLKVNLTRGGIESSLNIALSLT